MTGLHKDGREFPIEVSIGAVPGGGTVQFTTIMRDVSERVVNRARLAESERRLDLGQEFANIGTWDWNIQTGQVFWSSRVGPLLGYDDPEIGHSYDNFLAAIHAEERGGRAKVMYIEDNPANLALMEMIVTRVKGVALLSAHSAELGLELAEGQVPDLIVMDINLPGMSGIQAMYRLTKNPKTANIPVVALSANAMPRDIEEGLAAGFVRYLTKPINVEEVVNVLTEYMGN